MRLRGASGAVGRKRLWELESAIIAMLGGIVAQKLIKVGYRAMRRDKSRDTPFDLSNARFSWPNALLWAAAAGIGLGFARVMSNRVAAVGWELATGTPPPGEEDAFGHT